jgi:hypothetical protein
MNHFPKAFSKSAFSFIAFILFFSVSNAQTNSINANQKLIDAFGSEHISYLQQNMPDSIGFYNFIVENSFKVLKKETLTSNINYNSLKEIKINKSWIVNGNVDFKKFNVLQISVKPDSIKNMYYRINGTNDVLLLKSTTYNQKKFEGNKSIQK